VKRYKTKDVITVGFALFAMFFGAGNMIIPPYIGLQVGKGWSSAALGFGLSGIGLPLLGIMAMAKNKGSLEHFAGKVSYRFSILLGTLVILCIGPMLAIPRTGATTYEVGIKSIFPSISPIISSIIFFSLTLYFSMNKSKVIDILGKILTPILLLMLGVIIIQGIWHPLGDTVATGVKNPFEVSFTEGYQTMDALASIIFAGIVINSIKSKGYTQSGDQVKLAIFAGIIAAAGLFLVYGGLMYLGATASSFVPKSVDRAALLIVITNGLMGFLGRIPLGIAVSLACLTTAVGLTAATGNFFSEITHNKLSYKAVVITTTIISMVISNIGVERIIKLSAPVLVTLYPVVIVLITLNLFDNMIKNKSIYLTTIVGTFPMSLFNGLQAAEVDLGYVGKIVSYIPLSESGFGWLITAAIGYIIGKTLLYEKNSAVARKTTFPCTGKQ